MQDASVADFGMPELLLDAEAGRLPHRYATGLRPRRRWSRSAAVDRSVDGRRARLGASFRGVGRRLAPGGWARGRDRARPAIRVGVGSSWSVPLSVTTIRAQVRRASVTWQQDIVDAVCTRVAASITRIASNDWCGRQQPATARHLPGSAAGPTRPSRRLRACTQSDRLAASEKQRRRQRAIKIAVAVASPSSRAREWCPFDSGAPEQAVEEASVAAGEARPRRPRRRLRSRPRPLPPRAPRSTPARARGGRWPSRAPGPRTPS